MAEQALAAAAEDMQLETRKKNRFDDVEAALPIPALSRLNPAVSLVSRSGLLSRLGSLNPFAGPVSADDVVWLFDNTAFKSSRVPGSSWQAEYVVAVFEDEAKCDLVDAVSTIARIVGLADNARERETIEKRLLPFLWDVQPARNIRLEQEKGRGLKLGPTGTHGLLSEVVKVDRMEPGTFSPTQCITAKGTRGLLKAQTYYAAPEGWAILSDIDDTIKVTQTSDPIGILRETFINTPAPIPGMQQLYSWIQNRFPDDTPWFYLSASPYNLYPFLRDFRDQYFPPGMMILRDSSWKSVAGLLSALTMGTEEYKADRIRKVHGWFPKRKMILIGDSTQSDPEAYGEIYQAHPEWVKLILIRKALDVAAIGIEKKNEPKRFEKAFKRVPKEVWHTFEDPSECMQWIDAAVERD